MLECFGQPFDLITLINLVHDVCSRKGICRVLGTTQIKFNNYNNLMP